MGNAVWAHQTPAYLSRFPPPGPNAPVEARMLGCSGVCRRIRRLIQAIGAVAQWGYPAGGCRGPRGCGDRWGVFECFDASVAARRGGFVGLISVKSGNRTC